MTAATLTRALVSEDAEDLDQIRDPELSIAIWQRAAPAAVATLVSPDLSPVRLSCNLLQLPAALNRAIEEANYPAGAVRKALSNDIEQLARRFAAIMAIDEIDIRLDRVISDACRKFHADYVLARLITTYAGRGTQWFDGDAVALLDTDDVHELSAGDVAILKGKLWDDERAAIHRSPPIAGTGQERLLLTISPARSGD